MHRSLGKLVIDEDVCKKRQRFQSGQAVVLVYFFICSFDNNTFVLSRSVTDVSISTRQVDSVRAFRRLRQELRQLSSQEPHKWLIQQLETLPIR
jgi:hypothetical protein